MNVLSLFDGISCGQVALNRAGIKYDNYFASEMDKNAIKITMKNYPNTIQLGDVTKIDTNKLPKIDLMFGGSPCQSFSLVGKQLNFDDPRGQLFFEYVRILNEVKPKYFLLENVKMKLEYEDVISKFIGVQPIKINSSSVSAQSRPRLYWTNIKCNSQPEDKNLYFKDIIDLDESHYEYYSDYKTNKIISGEYIRNDALRIIKQNNKINCLTKAGGNGGADEPRTYSNNRLRKLTILEWERTQTLPDNYTEVIESIKKRKEAVGNGWTVDVIAYIFSFINEKKSSLSELFE